MSAGSAAKGHASKHVAAKKHAGTSKHKPVAKKPAKTGVKHHVTAKAKPAAHAKARGWSPESRHLPVCSLEAVAMSLRLAGQPVADDEVAWLWELAGARELAIPEALAAAARVGLAGFRVQPATDELVVNRSVARARAVAQPGRPPALDPLAARGLIVADYAGARNAADEAGHALILGVDRPGPHCVLATADGWWSWGELYSPWPCRVEEAWAVSWS